MEEENNSGSVIVLNNVYGEVCIRKHRRKRQKALVREMFYDYAKNTTLHGLSYTTKTGVTLVEKIFWLLTFIVSLCLCSYLIRNVWIKWKFSPVIVTISETLVPVRKVPFPSVTICPQSKVKASVYNYTYESEKINNFLEAEDIFNISLDNWPSYDECSKFDDISQICEDWHLYLELISDTYAKLRFKISNTSVTDSITSVAPRKEDIFVACIWRGQADKNCAETVTEVLTSEGLCYNVNSLAADEILRENSNIYFNATRNAINWTMEAGYSYYGGEEYPAPGKELGASSDLQIIFQDIQSDRDSTCNIVNSGFNKVYIHHPADLPQSSLHYYAVRNNEVSSMALSFNIINTSETLKKYSAETRQCYFTNDFTLKYFKIYTVSNCMIECLANITYDICGCAAFYMPRKNDTPICEYLSIECVYDVRELLVKREANEDESACRCLPPCYSIDYEAEILKTPFNLKSLMKQFKIENNSSVQYSKLEVYYKGSRFVSMHRSELFGITDFFANIGGLLSLFLGFSFLSIVEVFYYLTIRLFCALRKDLRQEKLN